LETPLRSQTQNKANTFREQEYYAGRKSQRTVARSPCGSSAPATPVNYKEQEEHHSDQDCQSEKSALTQTPIPEQSRIDEVRESGSYIRLADVRSLQEGSYKVSQTLLVSQSRFEDSLIEDSFTALNSTRKKNKDWSSARRRENPPSLGSDSSDLPLSNRQHEEKRAIGKDVNQDDQRFCSPKRTYTMTDGESDETEVEESPQAQRFDSNEVIENHNFQKG